MPVLGQHPVLEAVWHSPFPSLAGVPCTEPQSCFTVQAKCCQRGQQPTLPRALEKILGWWKPWFCHSVLFSLAVIKNLHWSAENYYCSTNKLPQQKRFNVTKTGLLFPSLSKVSSENQSATRSKAEVQSESMSSVACLWTWGGVRGGEKPSFI